MFALSGTGDDSAAEFDSLVEVFERKVFNLIYRLVNDYDEAADLTQDTFVAAFRAYEGFRAHAAPYTWLYRIAVNVCKNRFRERDRKVGTEALSLDGERGNGTSYEPVDPGPTPEKALQREELRAVVERAISSLPEDYRIAIVLREMHGLTYREIAEAADISVDLVKTRLARARAMLKVSIGPYLHQPG